MQRRIEETQLAERPKPTQQGGLRRFHSRCRCSSCARSSKRVRGDSGGVEPHESGRTSPSRGLGVAAAAAQRRVSVLASLPGRPGCGGGRCLIRRKSAGGAQSPASCRWRHSAGRAPRRKKVRPGEGAVAAPSAGGPRAVGKLEGAMRSSPAHPVTAIALRRGFFSIRRTGLAGR